MGNYGPAKRSEKACRKSPTLVSQLLQGLIVGDDTVTGERKDEDATLKRDGMNPPTGRIKPLKKLDHVVMRNTDRMSMEWKPT